MVNDLPIKDINIPVVNIKNRCVMHMDLSNLKIGIDFDKVIVDTISFKRWYLENRGFAEGDNDSEDFLSAKKALYEELETSLEHLAYEEDAVASLKLLLGMGATIKVVTLRDEISGRIPRAFFERDNLAIPVITVGRNNSKLPFVKDCDIFIDDDPNNLLEMVGTVPNLYVMHTEENKDFVNENIIRVYSWKEFVGVILVEQ